jgi:Uma2 family endonuclease
MATTTRTVTYEEWLEMPVVEDATEEVVNGEIRITPPNKWNHALVVENLSDILRAQVDENLILVLIAQFGLIIRRFPLTSRVPDLAVFLKKNIVEQDGYIHSAPELIVEVLSPANTRVERAAKLRDYEQIRVPEVWVLSPEARTVEVLELRENRLRTTKILAEGRISPTHFPGVSTDVTSIWPD